MTAWLGESVTKAVEVEFDRYIAAGDLAQTVERIQSCKLLATSAAASSACIFRDARLPAGFDRACCWHEECASAAALHDPIDR